MNVWPPVVNAGGVAKCFDWFAGGMEKLWPLTTRDASLNASETVVPEIIAGIAPAIRIWPLSSVIAEIEGLEA